MQNILTTHRSGVMRGTVLAEATSLVIEPQSRTGFYSIARTDAQHRTVCVQVAQLLGVRIVHIVNGCGLPLARGRTDAAGSIGQSVARVAQLAGLTAACGTLQ